MAQVRTGGSKAPVVIVVLLVAAALVLYFARDALFGPQPPETTSATDRDGAEIADESTASPSGDSVLSIIDESDSLADEVAARIVERIEEESATAGTGEDAGSAGAAAESETQAGDEPVAGTLAEAAQVPGASSAAGDETQQNAFGAEDAAGEGDTTMSAAATGETTRQDSGTAGAGEDAGSTASTAESETQTGDDLAAGTLAEAAQVPGASSAAGDETQQSALGAEDTAGEGDTTMGAAATGETTRQDSGTAGAGEDAASTASAVEPETQAGEDSAVEDAAGEGAPASATLDVPSGAEQDELAKKVAQRVAEEISDILPSPNPATIASATAAVAEELGLDVATLAQAVTDAVVEEQAEAFVDQITDAERHAIDVDAADHFVTREQIVSLLPEASFELTTLDALLNDPELPADTPITVVREVEEIQIASPAKVLAWAGGDLEQEVEVLVGDEVEARTLAELLEDLAESPSEPIRVVHKVKYFDVTTPAEFVARSEGAGDEPLTIVRDRYTLEAASVAELLRRELDLPSDAIFYLRTVRPEDEQGIWGIVQDGLSGNFARGMAIRYGQSVNTYRVHIPEHADEILPDQSSSFLGKLIHTKTRESYVYNFRHHRMGRNPDRIFPGQEIVIINFLPEELISIFKHFVEQGAAAG